MSTINVIVADSTTESREQTASLLQGEPSVNIADQARDGHEAMELVRALHPDVLLVDAGITGKDIVDLTEEIVLRCPGTGVVIVSATQDMDLMRKVMRAGASDFLIKPLTREDVVTSVTGVYTRIQKAKEELAASLASETAAPKGQIICVYSPQGGSGKTVLSANLAVAFAMHSGGQVALVDLNLQFGDVDLVLNLAPEYTIAGLAQKHGELDEELVLNYLTTHAESGLKVLAAPASPEYADTITLFIVERVLDALKRRFDYIIIDTPSLLQDTALAAMDVSDHIILLTTLDLLALHNTKTALDMLQRLYAPAKIKLALNRSNADVGISPQDVESTLGLRITAYIPSEGRLVVTSVNEGTPFTLSHPESQIAKRVIGLAYDLMGREHPPELRGDTGPDKVTRQGGLSRFMRRALWGE